MNSSSFLYEQVIEPIEDRMIRAAWRITHNAQDAEDAMQNALLTVWKRRRRIGRHPNPQALVLRICIDAACDLARRRARHRRKTDPRGTVSQIEDGGPLPWEVVSEQELCREILTAIHRLSRYQAVAITLCVFEELPYDQIAAAMSCTEATVRKHVERARGQLRFVLAKHEPNRSTGR
jgi:RNA polymerase sigma factor (sigma-70 family)